MFPTHKGLVHSQLDVVRGSETAKSLLKDFSAWGKIKAVSSVYKRNYTGHSGNASDYLEFVFCFETSFVVQEVLSRIMKYNSVGNQGVQSTLYCNLTLLAFDETVTMSPKLTLPHPELHKDPLIIRCASEVWGQYEHPIYRKNLNDLSRSAPPVREAEFFLQGKTLVDF